MCGSMSSHHVACILSGVDFTGSSASSSRDPFCFAGNSWRGRRFAWRARLFLPSIKPSVPLTFQTYKHDSKKQTKASSLIPRQTCPCATQEVPSSPPSSTHVLPERRRGAPHRVAAPDGSIDLVEFLCVKHVQIPAGETPFSSLCKHLINCL